MSADLCFALTTRFQSSHLFPMLSLVSFLQRTFPAIWFKLMRQREDWDKPKYFYVASGLFTACQRLGFPGNRFPDGDLHPNGLLGSAPQNTNSKGVKEAGQDNWERRKAIQVPKMPKTISQGTLKLGWPFWDIPNGGKGRGLCITYIDRSWDVGLFHGRSVVRWVGFLSPIAGPRVWLRQKRLVLLVLKEQSGEENTAATTIHLLHCWNTFASYNKFTVCGKNSCRILVSLFPGKNLQAEEGWWDKL